MQTRLRELRKRHGLTLQQVADAIGTTAQTVQRLETAHMTVSIDWLSRFSNVFGVRPSDMIVDDEIRNVPLLGRINRDGKMTPRTDDKGSPTVNMDVVADEPVAVKLGSSDVGEYAAGSYLIGDKLTGDNIVNAHGKDCIVQLAGGTVLLRRLICRNGQITLVPIEPSGDIRFDADVEWAARVIMQVRYL